MTASERPHDKGGPRPENQRKRTEIRGPRHALIALLALAALGAILVGVMLIQRGDGRAVGLSPEVLLGSPFHSFRGLGLVLAILIGGTQAVAAALFLRYHARARHGAAVAAGIAVAVSALMVMLMARHSWLEVALFGLGFIEFLLVAACTPRKPSDRKHRFGRR